MTNEDFGELWRSISVVELCRYHASAGVRVCLESAWRGVHSADDLFLELIRVQFLKLYCVEMRCQCKNDALWGYAKTVELGLRIGST